MKRLTAFLFLFHFLVLSSVFAQNPEITNGLSYIASTQNPDGSWGGTDTSINTDFYSTGVIINTLKILEQNNTQIYINGVQWLNSYLIDNAGYIAWRILALSGENIDLFTDLNLLLQWQYEDGGWGGFDEFVSNNFHTALALQALKAVNYSDQTVIQSAIDYLLSTQNTDGGFGFYPSTCSGCDGDESNVYMTALVSSTLQQFPRTTSIATAINKATSYLIAHQNTDGGFGGSPPTVYETAIAYLALVGETTDATVLGNAINYLTSTQLPNGSWNDDPYSTALALRALANVKPNLSISSNDISFSNPIPTVGETITISVNVKNSGIAQAVGVSVQFYDGDPSSGGALIEETTITSIATFGSEQTGITYTIPTASSKIIFIQIDPLNTIDELDETDNIASKNLTSSTLPDLSITSADIEIFPPAPDPYIMVGIFIKVRNHGETDATDVLVEVYDGDPANGGVKLSGSGTVQSIPAGGVADVTAAIAGENVTGLSKDIYVLVDPQNTISESNETNNQAIKTFLIGASIDLGVSSEDIIFTPSNPKEGDIVQITSTVGNSMLGTASNIKVRFYLGDPDSGGTQIGTDIVIPEISSRGTATVSTTWNTTGHTGNNHIYVYVDPDNAIAEDNENNNIAFKTLKVATSQGPDLTVISSDITFSPPLPSQGDIVTITANIGNIGNQDASNVLVGFSLGDPEVGGTTTFSFQTIPFIAQGSSASVQATLNTAGLSGTYEIYVNADAFNEISEMNEENNITYAPLEITAPQGPDLSIEATDTTALVTDTQSLEVTGSIQITIENKGNQDTNAAFEITVFEDRDKNKILDSATDNILGIFTYTNTLTAGTTDTIDIPVSGNVLFRDNLIYIIADSGNTISELDETNNIRHTSQECEYLPPVRTLNPVQKWAWTTSTVMPDYNQVTHTPVVARIADTNGDGLIDEDDVPAVIFSSYSNAGSRESVLRALRGDNGQEIFTVTDPLYRTAWPCSMAVGDIDNDGLPEIVAVRATGGLIVFENDGTYKWHTTFPAWITSGSPSIADIDEDGTPEIIMGNIVFNSDGTLKWQGTGGYGGGGGAVSTVANIDMAGHPEIVAGNTVYRSDGTILWINNTVGDGFNAVANLDEDPYPEIVVVSTGKVSLLEHTGEIKWANKTVIGGGHGGAPTIADLNGDGKPEIIIASGNNLVAYSAANGSPIWMSSTHDYTSMVTSATVFDLDGDGSMEVIYSDEFYFRIYRGSDGIVLFETKNSSYTTQEYPVVADIDNDDHAEIVICADSASPWWYPPEYRTHNGIRVFEDQNDSWVNTRKIWNQHTYHITNVNDDGTIPRTEQNNWEIYNNYRCNLLITEETIGKADITASYITINQKNYPTSVTITARIGNGGAASQISGVDVAFYDGDPNQGGTLIGTANSTVDINKGDYEDVSVTWNDPTSGNHTIFVVADKDNEFDECRENNNIASADILIGGTPPVYLPDLSILQSDVMIIPPDTIEGQSAAITAIIYNIGTLGASDVVVSFYDGDPQSGGVLIGSVTKSYIDSDANALTEMVWDTFGQSGRNYIHVIVDPQNLIEESNENNNSTLLSIDVAPPSKPDLAITSSDITFSSLNPKEGDPLTLNVTIHNLGTDASDIGVNLYDGDPSSGGILLSQKTIQQIIPFGGTYTLSFSLDTIGLTGNHNFYISIDPNSLIDETNETNNIAWNSLTIGEAGLSLSVSTDKTTYTSDEDIQITVNIQDMTGSDRSGEITVKIVDLNNNVVSIVISNEAIVLSPNENKVLNYTWNTGQTLSGNYKVYSHIVEGGNVIARADTPITISPVITISTKVTTDKISYFANEPVTITSTIQSTSTNYVFENLTATIAISSQQSANNLYTETQTIPILLPGQQTELKTYWNTSTNPPGDYPVTLEVKDSSGTILSSSTATITVSEEIKPSKLLKGQISVDKQSLFQGDPVAITYSVTNVGNIDLSQVDLSILTVHVVELTPYDTLTDQTSLMMGDTYNNTQQLSTNAYSAKDYLVILRAKISEVEETLAGTYLRVEGAPSAPSLNLPRDGSDIETYTPELTVNNASDPNDDDLTYQFELYTDRNLTNLISSSGTVPEGENITSWQVPIELQENQTYYWRVRAYDGQLYGEWMTPASFRVNLTNEPPTAPTLSSPADNSEVDTYTPVLVVNNATDPDSTGLTYNFGVASDPDFMNIVTSVIGVFEGQGTTSWQVPEGMLSENTHYYWRAQADDWFIEGPWMATAMFFVNTANDAPTAPTIILPSNDSEITTLFTDITVSNSTDPDYDPLTYIFQIDKVNTFDSPDLIHSNNIPQGTDTTSWHIKGLSDNTYYYSRAKASDGLAESPWSEVIGFFANTTNEAPTTPVLANPSDGAGVNVFTPTLSVHNSEDIDRDILTYEFEVYDNAMNLVSSVAGVEQTPDITSWTVPVNLVENETYTWRARAYDGELYSDWMPFASFMVNTANDAPDKPTLHSPADGSSIDTLYPTLSVENAEDPDGDTLTYDFEIYTNGQLIQSIASISQDISGITSITLTSSLADNTTYNWRARAYDGDRYGAWMDMATFSIHLPVTNITATIDFDPNTLNQGSNGKWVVVYIELPTGYKVSDIQISSILFNGTIHAEAWPYSLGDYDKDGIPDLMVKFKRADVINLLPNGDKVQVLVTGTAGTNTFEGVDTIRVIK
jgi:subtilase family serine protease/prenyltransferase beta subunit